MEAVLSEDEVVLPEGIGIEAAFEDIGAASLDAEGVVVAVEVMEVCVLVVMIEADDEGPVAGLVLFLKSERTVNTTHVTESHVKMSRHVHV